MKCKKCNANEIDQDSSKLWCRECRRQARQVAIDWKRDHPKALWSGRDYASRDFILRQMGFKSYRDYLKSDLWQKVRAQVFQEKGRICHCCGNPATSVHHNRYHRNDLTGKTLTFLFPICAICHDGVEFSKKKHKKMPLHHAKNELKQKGDHLANILLNFDATCAENNRADALAERT